MPRETCPVCASPGSERFLHRRGVPVHQNMLFGSAGAARAIARGELDMRACPVCGFVYNAAFDPDLVDYGPAYENSQDHSPAFNAHLDQLAAHLVVERGVRSGCVVEVGCGKGVFLHKVLAHPLNHSTGVGFDPAYLGPSTTPDGRARFVTDFYGPRTAVPADAVICRHVIEHVPEPLDLLCTVRAAVGGSGGTRVFFETPCVEWILRNRVPWDFFYEHCSLFTAHSLGLALQNAGFGVTGVRHVFGGQYLWAEGGTHSPGTSTAWDGSEVVRLAQEFAADERERVTGWRTLLDELTARGPVFAWGAGAKGVTFCNLADPHCERLAGVVDVNPAKQGKFLSGTGHPIVPPVGATGAAAVLVFNPNYLGEVRAALRPINPTAEVIDPMQEAAPCGS